MADDFNQFNTGEIHAGDDEYTVQLKRMQRAVGYGTAPDGSGGTPTVGSTPRVSQGPLRAIPTTTANGTELGSRPSATNGVEAYVPPGATFSWFIAPAGSTPSSPPSEAVQEAASGRVPIRCSTGDGIFILASTLGTGTGTPHINWRWIQT